MLTLTKLAKLAHVSVSTASKAFSMSSEVSEQTRDEIFRIAKEYGCFKKFYNAKYPRYVVAVLCPELRGRHYSRLVVELQEQLGAANCEICVASTDFSPETRAELFTYYHDYSNVDGIVVIDGSNLPESRHEIPIVSISSHQNSYADANITLNSAGAVRQIVDYFCEAGVTDITYLGEMHTSRRKHAFLDSMSRHGLKDPRIIEVEARFEQGGYEGMLKILSLPKEERPRAVFCAYDHLAIGAIKCASDHGIAIPGEIAVVGMDNVPEAEYLTPSLSSVTFHTEQVCRAAAETMLDLLNGKPVERVQYYPAQLILRDSARI